MQVFRSGDVETFVSRAKDPNKFESMDIARMQTIHDYMVGTACNSYQDHYTFTVDGMQTENELLEETTQCIGEVNANL